MSVEITTTGNTIKYLKKDISGSDIKETRFNATGISISLKGTSFKLISNDRYVEGFELSEVTVPANSGAQDLLTKLKQEKS